MKRFALLVVIMFSCEDEPTFNGLPDNHQCSDFVDKMGVCVAGGREYTCIASGEGCAGGARGTVECTPGHMAAREVPKRQRQHDRDNDDTTTYLLLSQ
jgi:hypothetical protein